jgi:serine protease Do
MIDRSPFRLFAMVAVIAGALLSPSGAAGEAAFFGMHLQGMAPAMAEALGLERAHGVLIRDVALGGPSDRAGFERGDLIVSFGGKDIDTFKQLVSIAGGAQAGETLAATVLRHGAEVDLTLETGKWPKGWRIKRDAFFNLPEIGITLAAVTPKVRKQFGLRWGAIGVLVTLIDKTKTEGMDLRQGDLVVQVNQQPVWEPKQLAAAYRQAKSDGRQSLLLLVEGMEGVRNGFRFSSLPVR